MGQYDATTRLRRQGNDQVVIVKYRTTTELTQNKFLNKYEIFY